MAGAVDEALLARWEPALAVREAVKKAVEEARVPKDALAQMDEAQRARALVNPLEARVELTADEATYRALHPYADQLPTVFVVSQATLSNGNAEAGVSVRVSRAEGEKCGRCWLIKTDVGSLAAHPTLCGRCAAAIE
jgi:isoleucyl-tRNA synthetase